MHRAYRSPEITCPAPCRGRSVFRIVHTGARGGEHHGTVTLVSKGTQPMTDNTLRILRGVDPDAGTSRSRMTRKGLRKGWLKHVTGTDTKGVKGGYQFLGSFVDPGNELDLGSVVVNKTPESGWRAGVTVPRSSEKGDPDTECVMRWTVDGVDLCRRS